MTVRIPVFIAVTVIPVLIVVGAAMLCGAPLRPALFGGSTGGVIAVTTGLAQLFLVDAGIALAFAAQAGALVVRLLLVAIVIALVQQAGMDAAVVAATLAPTLAAAVITDAVLLSRRGGRANAVEDLVRA